jgi:hypothetical protein
MISSTVGVDRVGDFLPLHFRQSLVAAHSVVKVVRVDAVEVLLDEHLQKLNLRVR